MEAEKVIIIPISTHGLFMIKYHYQLHHTHLGLGIAK